MAEHIFQSPENRCRALPPNVPEDTDGATISGAEAISKSTASTDVNSGDKLCPEANSYKEPKRCHRILLDLESEPNCPSKGFVFGTNDTCDVFLGSPGHINGISGEHFSLNGSKTKWLCLAALSERGLAVSYSGQAAYERRRKFTWLLDIPTENGDYFDIQVHVPSVNEVNFRIDLTNYHPRREEHNSMKQELPKCADQELLSLDSLKLKTRVPTVGPARLVPLGDAPVLLNQSLLGSGSYGHVYKVVDASTGETFAKKVFQHPLKLDVILREIRILSESKHDNIVQILHSVAESPPYIVMPYFPRGSLHHEQCRAKLTRGEVMDLLSQMLNAIQYLHSRHVVHRDVKPANILVETRSPLKVKLADFGFANDATTLRTECGTPRYMAPELVDGRVHSYPVDIWALGVVVLQYTNGLPSVASPRSSGSEICIWSWPHRIFDYVQLMDSSSPVQQFLAGVMLQLAPEERLPASGCLTRAEELGLFDHHSTVEDEPSTPQQPPRPHASVTNIADSATVVTPSGLKTREDSCSATAAGTLTVASEVTVKPLAGSKRQISAVETEDLPEKEQVKRRLTSVSVSASAKPSKRNSDPTQNPQGPQHGPNGSEENTPDTSTVALQESS